MSRVDEALRRAGVEPAVGPAGGSGEPVSSPWVFEHEQTRSAAHEAQRPRSVPEISSISSITEKGPWRFTGFSAEWRDRLVSSSSVDPAFVEQFRRLAATLHHAQSANNIKVIMVASAAPGDGKTMTAMNLSLILSGSYGRRVLLIDADLRRPSIQALSQLPAGAGLSDALKASAEQKLPVFPLTENLVLLPGGRAEPDPMSALTSPRMRRILEEASGSFDWVIVDAAPIGPVTDASLLAEGVDAILLVVRAGKTPYPAVHKALEVLGRERILGVVLNGTTSDGTSGYAYYSE